MTPGTPLIDVQDLHLRLPTREGPVELLRGVDLHVAPGEAVGLVGESGSGKSLTARCIGRLLPQGATVDGSVTFGGSSVFDMQRDRLHRYRCHDVAMIFQDPRAHINPIRRVGDFLVEGLVDTRGVSKQEAVQRAAATLEEVGVDRPTTRMRQHPHELSGGLLQRVMIAAALLIKPSLLLADEISTALDVTTQEEVMAILDELRRERHLSMVFITHDLDLAAAVCDRLVVMRSGRVVETLSAQHLDAAADPYTIALAQARVRLEQRPVSVTAAGSRSIRPGNFQEGSHA